MCYQFTVEKFKNRDKHFKKHLSLYQNPKITAWVCFTQNEVILCMPSGSLHFSHQALGAFLSRSSTPHSCTFQEVVPEAGFGGTPVIIFVHINLCPLLTDGANFVLNVKWYRFLLKFKRKEYNLRKIPNKRYRWYNCGRILRVVNKWLRLCFVLFCSLWYEFIWAQLMTRAREQDLRWSVEEQFCSF